MPKIAERLIELVTDATLRGLVNAEAERIQPKDPRRCALTASLYLKKAGVLTKLFPGTIQLQRELEKLPVKRINDYRSLQPGDICFSQDLKPENDKPDHVYIFVDYDGTKAATIVDNKAPYFHSRNLLSGANTPFAFALRLLDSKAPDLSDGTTRAAFAHFFGLEEQGLLLPDTAKKLHIFRQSEEFKSL
jgi:hypothetical protein